MWIKSPVDRQRFVDRLGTADAEFRGISATALRAYNIDDIAPMIGRMVLTEQDPATRVALVNLLGHSSWEGRQHVLDQLLRELEPDALDSLTLQGRLRDAIEQAR